MKEARKYEAVKKRMHRDDMVSLCRDHVMEDTYNEK